MAFVRACVLVCLGVFACVNECVCVAVGALCVFVREYYVYVCVHVHVCVSLYVLMYLYICARVYACACV